MKRTLPVITVLITISLLGLIFFQVLWLKSAKNFREQQLDANLVKAVDLAAQRFTNEKPPMVYQRKNDLLFSGGRMSTDFRKYIVTQRFSKEEIDNVIKESFTANKIGDVKFEFAVTLLNTTQDQVESDNFNKFYIDDTNVVAGAPLQKIIPITPPSGSNLENLLPQEFLVVVVPNQNSIVLKKLTWFIMGSIIFTLIIITAFFLTLRTLLAQKKLGEIKSDFINNMTHEFKTPLATISLAVDALKNEKVAGNEEKTKYFTGIIKEENKRMNKQVETILQAALLDKQEVQLNLKKMSAHALITNAVNNISLPIAERGGTLVVNLDAPKDIIMADEVHFTNFVNNLLDNALKYSKDVPEIKLTTFNSGHMIRIKIEDNGIGMNKETVSRIFEKFYRAHTGNVHNVKGFGLGLSYVKTMVEAHKGSIKAESTLGKGSCFTISFPLAK